MVNKPKVGIGNKKPDLKETQDLALKDQERYDHKAAKIKYPHISFTSRRKITGSRNSQTFQTRETSGSRGASVRGRQTIYNHREIERFWQDIWAKESIYSPDMHNSKNPFYNLWMFPYPSAEGVHAGTIFSSTGSDVYGRYKRMKGYDVFQPIGYDSFGIHSENYALKIGEHPKSMLERTLPHFKKQLKMIGHGYDWTRTVTTSDIDYYRWTQWLFVQMFKFGLAYRKKAEVNFCPSCKTVLSDEQVVTPSQAGKDPKNARGEVVEVVDGLQVCERCGTIVERKELEQWMFRITRYADRLLKNLDGIKWPEKIKIGQRNWIGKKEGAEIKFIITNLKFEIAVFTTRPDTLYGATFMVVSPEYAKEFLINFVSNDKKEEVLGYVDEHGASVSNSSNPSISSNMTNESKQKTTPPDETKYKSGLPDETRVKSGVDTGLKVINPATGREIPVWVSDYVLSGYGTGAIMAVPAHDERDFEFARKFNLQIVDVIMPVYGNTEKGSEHRKTISAIVQRKSDHKFLIVKWKEFGWIAPVVGGIEDGEDSYKAAEREILEETGYKVKAIRNLGGAIESNFYAENKRIWRCRVDQPVLLNLIDEAPLEVSEEERKHEVLWLTYEEVMKSVTHEYNKIGFERFVSGSENYDGEGKIINSGNWNGLKYPQDYSKVLSDIEEKGWGKRTSQYHLRDWLISRQRYWGCPIPMIYCDKCAKAGKSYDFKGETLQVFDPEAQTRRGVYSNLVDWSSAGWPASNANDSYAGWFPVPEKDLPVELPFISDYKPKGEGRGPLDNYPEFYDVKCPNCGGKAKRETDVADTFFDSSWYFLRYPSVRSAHSGQVPFDSDINKKWLPVSLYFGGAEHTVLHLMYARFVTMALHDMGYLEFSSEDNSGLTSAQSHLTRDEPFPWFYAHGLMIKDGAKMSKSRGNIVNPDKYIEKFGADTLRLYLMFMGPMDGYPDFRDTGIEGMRRFIEKLWGVFQISNLNIQITNDRELRVKMHQTIKKVTEDIENFRYNTAISAIMEYVNSLRELLISTDKNTDSRRSVKSVNNQRNSLDTNYLKTLALLLAPFAPHLAEEAWQSLIGETQRLKNIKTKKRSKSTIYYMPNTIYQSVHTHAWPSYDPKLIVEDTITIAVQVNGKLRAAINVQTQITNHKLEIIKMAKDNEKVKKWLEGKEILNEIYVPGRLVNFVV